MSDTCRVCGCTEFAPCPGGCTWAGDGVCTRCAPPAPAIAAASKTLVIVVPPEPALSLPCASCGDITTLVTCSSCGGRFCRVCGPEAGAPCLNCRDAYQPSDLEDGQ